MNINLRFLQDACKTHLGFVILVVLAGCAATSAVTLVESSNNLEDVSGQPRWGIVEFLEDAEIEARRMEAHKIMNTFCEPQKYEVAYERTRQEPVPCWFFSGTGNIVSCGDQIVNYTYIKYECAD